MLHNGLRRGILPLHGLDLSKRGRREQCFERGRVRQYRLTNGTLKAKGTIKLPSAFRATGAALAKLEAEGPQHLVFVDARHHLRVYRGSEELWKSPSSVGGSYTYGEVERTITRGDVITQSFFFEPIPAAVDLDGDGIEEVLMARNEAILDFVPNLGQYSGGDVVLLHKEEPYGFVLSPISPQFNGLLSGVVALPGSTPAVLIAVVTGRGLLKRGGQTTLFLSRFQ